LRKVQIKQTNTMERACDKCFEHAQRTYLQHKDAKVRKRLKPALRALHSGGDDSESASKGSGVAAGQRKHSDRWRPSLQDVDGPPKLPLSAKIAQGVAGVLTAGYMLKGMLGGSESDGDNGGGGWFGWTTLLTVLLAAVGVVMVYLQVGGGGRRRRRGRGGPIDSILSDKSPVSRLSDDNPLPRSLRPRSERVGVEYIKPKIQVLKGMAKAALGKTEGWKHFRTTKNVMYYSAPAKGGGLMVLGHTKIDAPARAVIDVTLARNIKLAQLIDPYYDKVSYLEYELDNPQFFINWVLYKQVLMVSPRELLMQSWWEVDENGTFYIVASSIPSHPDKPSVEGVVRSTVHLGGWIITPLSPTSCDVIFTSHFELGGSVYQWVANKLAQDLPNQLIATTDVLSTRNLEAYAGHGGDRQPIQMGDDLFPPKSFESAWVKKLSS
jgi:hypothetical protein